MVSKEIISKHYLVGLGGLVFSAIYLNTSYFFEGFGGALGTTACISVIIVFGLRIILNKRKQKANF
jgi:multisubunit Na+/H+ antiporter MnhB subunit